MPVDTSGLNTAIEAIRKAYGADAVHAAADTPPVARVPTGSLELDVVTNGGIPIGRWTHMYGGFSSAKSLTCWKIIAECQRMGMDVAYYNVEKQFDAGWTERHGVDIQKLLVVEGSTIEGVGKSLEALMGSVHVHVIDSIAQAVSIDELDSKVEEWRPGISSRAWGKVLRRANDRFDERENIMICVNQVAGAFGSGAEEPKTGKAVEYLSSLSLHFKRSSWLFLGKDGVLSKTNPAGDSLSGDKEPDGIEFAVRVAKSRVGPPLRSARLRLNFRTGEFDEIWALAKAAAYYGVVEKGATGWYKWDENGKEQKVRGEAKFREELASNEALAGRVRDTLMAKLG